MKRSNQAKLLSNSGRVHIFALLFAIMAVWFTFTYYFPRFVAVVNDAETSISAAFAEGSKELSGVQGLAQKLLPSTALIAATAPVVPAAPAVSTTSVLSNFITNLTK